MLEEAADNIPQILDHRFRLSPSVSPTPPRPSRAVGNRGEAVQYATVSLRRGNEQGHRGLPRSAGRGWPGWTYLDVEPFYLQLIRQRAEEIAWERQRKGTDDVIVYIPPSRRRSDASGKRSASSHADVFVQFLYGASAAACSVSTPTHPISPEGRRRSVDPVHFIGVWSWSSAHCNTWSTVACSVARSVYTTHTTNSAMTAWCSRSRRRAGSRPIRRPAWDC